MKSTINVLYKRSGQRSVRSYALKIDVAPTTLNKCIKGAEPLFSLLSAILNGEPFISAEWLLRNIGEMEKSTSPNCSRRTWFSPLNILFSALRLSMISRLGDVDFSISPILRSNHSAEMNGSLY